MVRSHKYPEKIQLTITDRASIIEEMESKEIEEILDRVSQSFPIDDAKNICIHTDEDGKQMLVSIPEND